MPGGPTDPQVVEAVAVDVAHREARAESRQAVRQERLFEVQDKFDQIFYGYGDYFIRLLLVAWRSNWRILEVPVFYILRRHGDSKTGFWSIFKQYTAAVLKLRVQGL